MSLDAIGIVSKNIPRTIQFYQLLDLELEQCGGPDHFEATAPNGMRLMVDSIKLTKELNPNWRPSNGHSITLGFKKDSPSNVDKTFSMIIDKGFLEIKKPWDAFWGQRYACVQDPDGNQIDIFADQEKR